MPAPSPRRRKSIALSERNMNNSADTLPARKGRGVSLGGDYTMTASWDLLSQAQKDRRTRQPRKSILKFDPQPDPEPEPEPESHSLPDRSRKSMLGFSRRVSFAPAAHVRMFETDKDRKRRKSSMGAGRRGSLPGLPGESTSGRRSSIQINVPMRAPRSPRSPQPPLQRSPKSPRVQSPRSPRPRYFVGEGEGAGEESMEMSEEEDADDESIASADSDEILQQLASPQAADESYATDESEEEEMDMEETTVMDAQIHNNNWAEDDTDNSDMSLEDADTASDEEKTMDFTVALGGPMPSVPPQDARPNRNSIGYLNPAAPGAPHAEPLHPGDATDSSVMEETAVYGGVYVDESVSSADDTHSDPDGRTMTYNFTNASGMEFTSVVGGIHAQQSDQSMDLTVAVGGIHTYSHTSHTSHSDMEFTTVAGGQYTEHTGMEFTSVVGGIHEVTETGMEFTAVVGGIHQRTNVFDTTTTMRSNIFDTSRPNIFAPETETIQTGLYPVLEPARQQTGLYPVLEPARPQARTYPVLEPARIDAVPEDSRSRSSASTPGRKTPTKSSTPSFMRPTAASAQKSRENDNKGKKRNPFAASPDTPGLERSKSRTPRSDMGTAAGVAKRLSFGPAASAAAAAGPSNIFANASVSASSSVSSASGSSLPSSTSSLPSASSSSAASATASGTASAPPSQPTPKTTPRKSLIPGRSTSKRPRDDEDETAANKRPNIFAMEKRALFEPSHSSAKGKGKQVEVEVEDEIEVEAAVEVAPQPEAEPEEEDMSIEEEGDDGDNVNADDDDVSPDMPEDTPQDTEERSATPEPAPPPKSTYTPIRDRRSSGRRKSMGTPVRPPPAGMRSPTPEADPDVEPAPIRLAQFLEMTNVEFMDHLPVAARRNSVGRGLLGTDEREFALHDFVTANIDAVHVHFFQWAIDKMVADIRDMGTELSGIEAALDEENPIVVREYLSANDEERPIFEMMLREYKANTVLRARSSWYDWKTGIMERIRPDVRAIRDEMAADAERFRAQLGVSAKLLPDLRSRHEQLKAELASHRAAVEKIEACDRDELKELKAGVAEQNAEIARFTAELEGKTARLAELQLQSAQLDSECSVHTGAIDAARAESSESSPADVLRLDAEFRALQDLHGWKLLRVAPLTLTYAGELELSVPLLHGRADIGSAALGLVDATLDGPTAGLLDLTRRALVHSRPATLPALVRATGQLWTAARHVRDELNILRLYYPASVVADETGITATARVVLPRTRAKVALSFALGPGTLLAWPSVHAVTAVRVRADVVYGSADARGIEKAAHETLKGVVPDVPGVFYQACASAVEA